MLEIIKFKKNFAILLLGVILLIHSLILSKLIYFPYPELFIYPYLANHGLKPYSQILDQHFPGPMFLPINLDNVGMNTPETARAWSIFIVILIHVMLFWVSGRILKSKIKALIVNILFLIWQPFFEGWILWIDNFLPLFLLPAFYALYKKRIFITGFLLGLSIVFKQTIIPLALLILIYIYWTNRNIKAPLKLFFGLSIPIGLMIIYLVSIGVFWDFWYWTVVFNLTIYAESGRGGGPTLAHFSRALLVFGTPFLIVRRIKSTEAQILLIFLTGTLFGLSTRFDFVHFQPVLPFALIAFVFALGSLGKFGRLGIIMLYSLIAVWWIVIFYKGHLGDRVVSFDSETRTLAAKIKAYTEPGEKIFVYGAAPHLYQMSDTLPAGDIFVFQFPWFLQVAEGRILEGIIKDKPKIIVSDPTVKIEGQKITEFAGNIDKFINQNYQKIDKVGTTDILQRR